jgi:hypothetical protein
VVGGGGVVVAVWVVAVWVVAVWVVVVAVGGD